ncbi:MAG: MarR family transcriptional regulator [Clostridiales bacterium]|nr:MarR family transcriptional regulator [Clostridiales bacterium]
MDKDKYSSLKLENQICFPLYAASREVIRLYRPFLDELELTYTQYIAMMVFWENRTMNVKELGQKLYLDSGTLTPVLKSLESKGYVTRERSKEDERVLVVTLTEKGEALKDKALTVPESVGSCVHLEPNEAATLYKLLYKLLQNLESEEEE